MSLQLPKSQHAVQLIAPDELILNEDKALHSVGPFQILGRVEAVGLCFSDLKLLKQFDKHARKEHILDGIDQNVLDEIESYVPDHQPTVPGHETTVRIVAVGDKVHNVEVGARYLVETDYRWLPTTNSNASFGYNFEGGLQQYVLMDQRVITSPDGQVFLLPASEKLSASAVALVEPWACVEDAYAQPQRTVLKTGGQMLVVADVEIPRDVFAAFIGRFGVPSSITLIAENPLELDGLHVQSAGSIDQLSELLFDDVIYFGSNPETLEKLFHSVAPDGLLNIVQCGGRFGQDVTATVGRFHYGNIRMIGTAGNDPAEAMQHIPATGEIRPGDKINVIGAGGPMGVMHVIRNICQGVDGISVYAADLDAKRLDLLNRIAEPMAQQRNVGYVPFNPVDVTPDVRFDYVALMAPVPKLVAQAVSDAADDAVINIFAGIPAHVTGQIDLDAYIDKRLYFIGTSGSVLEDMKVVLAKVEAGQLDTDISVAAVCGMAGAVEGIRAVENQLIPGKIIVYPACTRMGLVPLDQLPEKMPDVADCLQNGLWNEEAEKTLLQNYAD